jgi:hypothetical protein
LNWMVEGGVGGRSEIEGDLILRCRSVLTKMLLRCWGCCNMVWEDGCWWRREGREFSLLYEGNVIRIKKAVIKQIPKAISLRVGSIANENTRNRTMKNFWVVTRDEGKGPAPYLSKMGKRRFSVVPKLIRCFALICGGLCGISEVSGGGKWQRTRPTYWVVLYMQCT